MNYIIYTLKQIKHRLWLMWLYFEGKKDYRQLLKDFPPLRQMAESETQAALQNSYDYYTRRVSHPKMAASLETATCLYDLCSILKPHAVLDLGSGYSSYILALYKQKSKQKTTVCSVDDNNAWLTKTRQYLQKQKLPATKLMTWNAFQKTSSLPFKLIFYDLGTMKTRKEFFPYIVKRAKPGTFIIVDDMHMLDYQREVRRIVKQERVRLYSLRAITKDVYGRFAVLLVK